MNQSVTAFAERLRELDVPPEIVEFNSEVPTAASAADQLDCPLGAIANSLVFIADEQPLLIIASGAHRVDTRHVGDVLGAREIRRASPTFVREATGQPVGGVGPVGHPQPLRTVVDRWLSNYDRVWAGAGDKHTMFATDFATLLRVTDGVAAEVEIPEKSSS